MKLKDLQNMTARVVVPYRGASVELTVYTEKFFDPDYRKRFIEAQQASAAARQQARDIQGDADSSSDDQVARLAELEQAARLRDGELLAPLIAGWNIERNDSEQPEEITSDVIASLANPLRGAIMSAIVDEIANPTKPPATSENG